MNKLLTVAIFGGFSALVGSFALEQKESWILQADSVDTAREAVLRVGET